MSCISCGSHLPTRATYCLRCGKRQHPAVATFVEEVAAREHCEFALRTIDSLVSTAYIITVNVKGQGRQRELLKRRLDISKLDGVAQHTLDMNRYDAVIEAMVQELAAQGWTPVACSYTPGGYQLPRLERVVIPHSPSRV